MPNENKNKHQKSQSPNPQRKDEKTPQRDQKAEMKQPPKGRSTEDTEKGSTKKHDR